MKVRHPKGGSVVLGPNHVPLRIEWELSSAWVPPQLGLHLDGLLGQALVRRSLAGMQSMDSADVEDTTYDEILANIPLSRFEAQNGWVWCGSLLEAKVVGSERRYLTTKTPALRIAELTAEGFLSEKGGSKVDTVRGFYKAGAQYVTAQQVNTVTAFCIGDPDGIADLLSDVTALGSKTRLGMGQVLETGSGLFKMDEDEAALDLWQFRHMPVPGEIESMNVGGFVQLQGCLRTPYWRRDRVQAVWRPAMA